MPSESIVSGVEDTGGDAQTLTRRAIPLAVDKQGKLLTRTLVDAVEDTNRLLRKLINGLEMEVGREFPEVE